MSPAYRRVLLKLSGEALEGARLDPGQALDEAVLTRLAGELKEVAAAGVELAVVVGGGNFFRGIAGSAAGMDRTSADTMGMLATVMNCIAMEDALQRAGQPASILSALAVPQVCDRFSRRVALARLGAGEVLLLAGGTGHPYFSTDTAAALRALEVDAEVLLKATKVDGIYDRDPVRHPDAVRYEEISYGEVIAQRLQVMDAAAVALCRDNRLPLVVFNMSKPGNIARVIAGEPVGSRVVAERAA